MLCICALSIRNIKNNLKLRNHNLFSLGLLQLHNHVNVFAYRALAKPMVKVNTEWNKNFSYMYSVQHTQLSPTHNKLQSEFSEM